MDLKVYWPASWSKYQRCPKSVVWLPPCLFWFSWTWSRRQWWREAYHRTCHRRTGRAATTYLRETIYTDSRVTDQDEFILCDCNWDHEIELWYIKPIDCHHYIITLISGTFIPAQPSSCLCLTPSNRATFRFAGVPSFDWLAAIFAWSHSGICSKSS